MPVKHRRDQRAPPGSPLPTGGGGGPVMVGATHAKLQQQQQQRAAHHHGAPPPTTKREGGRASPGFRHAFQRIYHTLTHTHTCTLVSNVKPGVRDQTMLFLRHPEEQARCQEYLIAVACCATTPEQSELEQDGDLSQYQN